MTHPNPYDNVPTSDFDPYATEVLANPYPHYEQLRELGVTGRAKLPTIGVLGFEDEAGHAQPANDHGFGLVPSLKDAKQPAAEALARVDRSFRILELQLPLARHPQA
mgnify:CR=1 FL=1